MAAIRIDLDQRLRGRPSVHVIAFEMALEQFHAIDDREEESGRPADQDDSACALDLPENPQARGQYDVAIADRHIGRSGEIERMLEIGECPQPFIKPRPDPDFDRV